MAWGSFLAVALPATAAPVLAPNDPQFKTQWGLVAADAQPAWSVSTGKGVLIGIVDTGADLLHEDLAGKVVASTNCIGAAGDATQCKGNGQDDNGHGSHVAGIAAAVTGNAKGIAAMAPDAKLLIAKALDSNLTASMGDIAAGIHWVVDHGAKVVNLSFGDDAFTQSSVIGPALRDSIEYAWTKGAITVLAAGNASVLGFGLQSYGNLDAIVVGAIGRDGAVAGYSSPTGTAKWAVLAPGGSADGTPADDILSAYWEHGVPNAYRTLAGTSMAAPFVSGALALLVANGLSPATAVSHLLSAVNTKVACGAGSDNCHGLLDTGVALVPAASHPTSAPPVAPPTSAPPSQFVPLPTSVAPSSTLPPVAAMNPAHPVPTTLGPKRPATDPPVTPTLKDSHAVAVGPLGTKHANSSFAWLVLFGILFALAAGGGVFWVVRNSPEPD